MKVNMYSLNSAPSFKLKQMNITIIILDLIHPSIFYLGIDVSETESSLRNVLF
jgi:hypothetical protein